jgi:hypothetical protein
MANPKRKPAKIPPKKGPIVVRPEDKDKDREQVDTTLGDTGGSAVPKKNGH